MNNQTGFIPVFKRECRRILTSKIYIWGVICAFLISMGILMFMMNAGLPQKLPIAVVDLDNTATTRNLVRQLNAFPRTNIKYKSLSFKEAREKMERMEVYAILTIPRDFTKDAQSGDMPKLVYYTNNAFMITGSLLFQDLKIISTLSAASVGLKTGTAKGFTQGQIMPVVSPIKVENHPLNNPWLNYSIVLNSIILPCILQLIIMMFTISGLGSEIKARHGQELVALSGNSSWSLMLGKLVPNTIVFTTLALLLMSVLYYYNNFPLHCGFGVMFLNYFLLILAAQGYGVMQFAVLRNYRLAVSSASLVGIVSFSLVGFSFPTQSMYGALDALSYTIPAKYFYRIYGDQALNGIPLGYSVMNFVALLGFILLGMLLFNRARNVIEHDEYEI